MNESATFYEDSPEKNEKEAKLVEHQVPKPFLIQINTSPLSFAFGRGASETFQSINGFYYFENTLLKTIGVIGKIKSLEYWRPGVKSHTLIFVVGFFPKLIQIYFYLKAPASSSLPSFLGPLSTATWIFSQAVSFCRFLLLHNSEYTLFIHQRWQSHTYTHSHTYSQMHACTHSFFLQMGAFQLFSDTHSQHRDIIGCILAKIKPYVMSMILSI